MLHDIIYENASLAGACRSAPSGSMASTYIAGPALALIALANLIRLALGRVTDKGTPPKPTRQDPEEMLPRANWKVGRELAAQEEAARAHAGDKKSPSSSTLPPCSSSLHRTPISFALLGCALALMVDLGMTDPQIVVQNMWDGANSFPLLAVPFFSARRRVVGLLAA